MTQVVHWDLQVEVYVYVEFAHEDMLLQGVWVLHETKLGHLLISVFQHSLEVMEYWTDENLWGFSNNSTELVRWVQQHPLMK